MGTLQAAWPRPDALRPWFEPGATTLLGRHAESMATTALLLALIGGLESVLSIAAVDQLLDERTDPDRDAAKSRKQWEALAERRQPSSSSSAFASIRSRVVKPSVNVA